jgi:hypothetical protein
LKIDSKNRTNKTKTGAKTKCKKRKQNAKNENMINTTQKKKPRTYHPKKVCILYSGLV